MRDRCEYCETPYGDDRDENGLPFCECDAAEVDRLRTAIAEKDIEIKRLSELYDETQAVCNALGQTADNIGAQRNALQEQVDKLSSLETALVGKAQELECEIARLSGIIRAVEWVRYNQEYAVSDGFLACPICDNDFLLGHQDECPFYKWKGGKDD